MIFFIVIAFRAILQNCILKYFFLFPVIFYYIPPKKIYGASKKGIIIILNTRNVKLRIEIFWIIIMSKKTKFINIPSIQHQSDYIDIEWISFT